MPWTTMFREEGLYPDNIYRNSSSDSELIQGVNYGSYTYVANSVNINEVKIGDIVELIYNIGTAEYRIGVISNILNDFLTVKFKNNVYGTYDINRVIKIIKQENCSCIYVRRI